MSLTKKILLEYKKQNRAKFIAKFGDMNPGILKGIIGYTKPNKDNKTFPIWHQYTHAEIRGMGGVKIEPQASGEIQPIQRKVVSAMTDEEISNVKDESEVEDEGLDVDDAGGENDGE